MKNLTDLFIRCPVPASVVSMRAALGIVIFSGLSIGTLFMLFVVPAMYMLLAGERRRQRFVEMPD
jgi:multidrug efflux pump subunit AcrB